MISNRPWFVAVSIILIHAIVFAPAYARAGTRTSTEAESTHGRVMQVLPASIASAQGSFTADWESEARQVIVEQLISLGSNPDEAVALAGQLSSEDLAVLIENPNMMQRAGAQNQLDQAVLLSVLLLAGLIALGVFASSGSLAT